MNELLSKALSLYHEDKKSLRKETKSFVHDRTIQAVYNRYWNHKYGAGISILKKDWDNLLLLDACRYDEFLRVSPFNDELVERRVTVGSRTPEFLRRTFSGVQLHDTVYLTANPQPLKFQSQSEEMVFHDMISVLDEWDSETQTVRPEKVHEAVLEVNEKYPNKRLLIHFIQPHTPFLGPTASTIRCRSAKTVGGFNPGREYTNIEKKSINTAKYDDILSCDITPEEIRTAYRETLKIVLDEYKPLIKELSGKTAITSDHGELLGEQPSPLSRYRWGHPGNVRTSELCVVPWVEFNTKKRKKVTSQIPQRQEIENDQSVEKRLQLLGYK